MRCKSPPEIRIMKIFLISSTSVQLIIYRQVSPKSPFHHHHIRINSLRVRAIWREWQALYVSFMQTWRGSSSSQMWRATVRTLRHRSSPPSIWFTRSSLRAARGGVWASSIDCFAQYVVASPPHFLFYSTMFFSQILYPIVNLIAYGSCLQTFDFTNLVNYSKMV